MSTHRILIGYDEIRALTDRVKELYPPDDTAGARAWWAKRGVDYDGLQQFCMEDARDSLTSIIPLVAAQSGAPTEAIVCGAFAMTNEVGFLLGWLCARYGSLAQ